LAVDKVVQRVLDFVECFGTLAVSIKVSSTEEIKRAFNSVLYFFGEAVANEILGDIRRNLTQYTLFKVKIDSEREDGRNDQCISERMCKRLVYVGQLDKQQHNPKDE